MFGDGAGKLRENIPKQYHYKPSPSALQGSSRMEAMKYERERNIQGHRKSREKLKRKD